MKDWFLLSWKKLLIVVVVFVVSVLLHNFIYGLFGIEEAFFFIIAVFVIPIYLIVSIIYSLVKKYKK